MNLPNKISLARILICPVFLFLFIMDYRYAAAVVFIIASLSDLVDGKIARSRNLVTDLGKFLDPIADKILALSAMLAAIYFGWGGQITVWSTFIILTREFAITGFRCIAAGKGKVIAADIWGKIKTVTQDLALFLTLVEYAVLGTHYCIYLLALTALIAVISATNYILKNKEVLK